MAGFCEQHSAQTSGSLKFDEFILPAGRSPATSWGVHYTTDCNTQSSAPEDG